MDTPDLGTAQTPPQSDADGGSAGATAADPRTGAAAPPQTPCPAEHPADRPAQSPAEGLVVPDAVVPSLGPQGFDALGLPPPVREAIRDLGYEAPTPIQAECIPHILAGRDILGQAQTGTGKTAAFAVPLVSRIDLQDPDPQVLVLTPTRELALQVAEAFHSYGRQLPGFQVLPLYGGQSFGVQMRQLQRGAHVIVGTPGRVMDHMRQGYLSLEGIRALVLDEADEMLNMGFADDIEWIFSQAPAKRQVALFSATMPNAIRRVAEAHLSDPVQVRVAAKTATVDTIEQHHCVVSGYHKLDVLTRVLEVEPFDAMLVFVRTKNATLEVAEKLTAHGFCAEPLNGDMTQEARERAISRLKSGRLDILVATDVAARGLDVERISHVVNYDIPTDPEAYVHRVGRTGRAGRQGKALLFVQPRERNLLFAIERTIRQRIPPLTPPSAEQVSEHRIDRLIALLRATKAEQDLDFFYSLVARIEQEQEMSLLDLAAALTYLIQRERPLEVRSGPSQGREDRNRDRYRDQRREQGPEQQRPQPWERRDTRAKGRGEAPPYQGSRGAAREERPGARYGQGPGARAERHEHGQRSRDGDLNPSPEAADRAPQAYRARRPDGRATEGSDAGWRQTGNQSRREDRDGQRWDEPSRRPTEPGAAGDRPLRPRREDGPSGRPPHRPSGVPMAQYRIEVGRRDGVTPREIVGAIANEGGLDGRHIGRIDIQDDHCTLDLPDGMPREIQQHLRKVRVCGRPLNLTQVQTASQGAERAERPRKPRRP